MRSAIVVLPKGVVGDEVRFLFIAGLEGTGHHAWRSMLDICAADGAADGVQCKFATPLSDMLYHRELDPHTRQRGAASGLFASSSGADHDEWRARVVAEFQSLAQQATGPSLIIIMPDPDVQNAGLIHGMMSYPNGAGEDRTLHHPDVHLLSRLAESAAVDLRLLVLQRDASSILTSTVIHREFDGSAFHESLILSDAAFALQGQLSMLDQEFYHCALYGGEEMVFDTWSNRALANFVHPAFASFASPSQQWERMMKAFDDHERQRQLWQRRLRVTTLSEVAIERLSVAISTVAQQCSAGNSPPPSPFPPSSPPPSHPPAPSPPVPVSVPAPPPVPAPVLISPPLLRRPPPVPPPSHPMPSCLLASRAYFLSELDASPELRDLVRARLSKWDKVAPQNAAGFEFSGASSLFISVALFAIGFLVCLTLLWCYARLSSVTMCLSRCSSSRSRGSRDGSKFVKLKGASTKRAQRDDSRRKAPAEVAMANWRWDREYR